MSKFSFDAIIFDLDGVVTQTASVHGKAWKKTFDDYLKQREERYGEAFKEFTHTNDYLPFIDGKPRYKGVESFLKSRGITLPYGTPTDSPETETICGLGNKKNLLFNEIVALDGVDVYNTTVNLIKELKKNEIKIGIASSSKNCKSILEAAGLLDLFETRIDGVISSELGLKGKPEPDIFTTACDNLGVSYDRAIIVEDAVSGVQAGVNGNFGLILGVARENNEQELKCNGADIVVTDLGELTIDSLEKWFVEGLEQDKWSLSYFDYSIEKESTRESLLTVGNGYFGTRGAMVECDANGINYPGTYIAGVYNRLKSHIAGRTVVNEDFVNCSNWLPITFKIDTDEWFDFLNLEILSIKRTLDFKTGILKRQLVVKDKKGRETLIESKRLASMKDAHLAALRYSITPLNYSGKISVKSGLNGNIINAGVERYKQLNSKHLEPVTQGGKDNTSYLMVQTNQSKITITEAAKLIVSKNDEKVIPKINLQTTKGAVYSSFSMEVKERDTISIDKLVAIYTSNDQNTDDLLEIVRKEVECLVSFEKVERDSAKSWLDIWNKMDVRIEGDRLVQKLIRLHMYHLLVTASPFNVDINAGIPARGLHGEAYRGHIFWDTLFILPFFTIHFPEIAKSALFYRYSRLNKARENAKEYGYEGAIFPWQSGSDGGEETQALHLNPISGKWSEDHSYLQRHVSLAIAYNIWQYYWITNDIDFLEKYGAELFFEICRLWTSKSKLNKETGRYEIKKILGPDEYHEKYPNLEEAGLKDNFYTNIMVIWAFTKAIDILHIVDDGVKTEIVSRIKLSEEEIKKWEDIRKKLNIVISDKGIFAQYDGYFDLKELDWAYYRKKYGNIARMDRILKAEGKSPDEYKVSKQADVLMTFYNLHPHKVREILDNLGYTIRGDYLHANYHYYLKRTSHGSTLSKVVHSHLANLIGDKKLSYKLYIEAIKSDYVDIQGGTTGEGIHTGVMAGTVLLALYSYAGLDLRAEKIRINPCLPDHWRKMIFNIDFKGDTYYFEITTGSVKVRVTNTKKTKIKLVVYNDEIIMNTGKETEFKAKSEVPKF
ncbi:MAG: HAD-IA family hydrolase [Promethearchaeota archaeon]